MNMELVILESGIKHIKLTGRLDMKGTMEIENTFAFNTTTKKDAVLVDMSSVDFIASIGIRMLLNSARALDRRGGKMVVLSPQPMVKKVLSSSGVDELLSIYDDFDVACTDLAAVFSL